MTRNNKVLLGVAVGTVGLATALAGWMLWPAKSPPESVGHVTVHSNQTAPTTAAESGSGNRSKQPTDRYERLRFVRTIPEDLPRFARTGSQIIAWQGGKPYSYEPVADAKPQPLADDDPLAVYPPKTDGHRVAVSTDAEPFDVKIVEGKTKECLFSLKGHRKHATGHFGPRGKRIATVGDDDRIGIWDGESGKNFAFIPVPRLFRSSLLTFSPDQNYLFATTCDNISSPGDAILWDLTGKELSRVKNVNVAELSRDGTRLVLVDWNKFIHVLDTAGFRQLGHVQSEGYPVAIAISRDRKRLAVTFYESRSFVTIFSLDPFRVENRFPLMDAEPERKGAAFSPDGRHLLVATKNDRGCEGGRDIRVYEVASGQEVRKLGAVGEISFSADGNYLLTGNKLWSTRK